MHHYFEDILLTDRAIKHREADNNCKPARLNTMQQI